DIDGVGEQTVWRLWETGLVRSLPDLYRLTAEQLMELDGFGEISAGAAIAAIEASKAIPFSRVLFGLNIPDVGWVTAQTLARHFGTVEALMQATQEELVEAEGIGPERAEAIAEWFRDDDNRALVEELRGLGLRFELGDEDKPVEGPLTGQTYVITGTLESMTREDAAAALEALGAKVGNSVSSKTTALVVGEDPGKSKLTKAEKAGTPQIGEEDLLKLLGRGYHRRETVLRDARPRERHGEAVLQHREDVPVADEPGERRRVRRRAGLRPHDTGRGPGAHPVRQRPRAARDRKRREELEPDLEVLPHRREERHERVRGEPVEQREPGAVDQADAAHRHARLLQQPADDADAGGGRAAAGLHRAELLDEHLGHEVVAHAIHPLHDARDRRRVDGGERRRRFRRVSVRGAARDADAHARQGAAKLLRGGERRVGGGGAADPAAVDDERRERRRLDDVEGRLPAECRPARVEPRLVGEDAPGDGRDSGRADLTGEVDEVGARQRRVAVSLENEVALPH